MVEHIPSNEQCPIDKVLTAARREIAGKRFMTGSPLHLIEMLIKIVEDQRQNTAPSNGLLSRVDELLTALELQPGTFDYRATVRNWLNAHETFDVPMSPHMPKRERPQKAPDKSGAQYIRELVTYCGLTQAAILGIAYSHELEFLLEQLANAKDDALRLHHAYVDLRFPEMARGSEKADDQHEATK